MILNPALVVGTVEYWHPTRNFGFALIRGTEEKIFFPTVNYYPLMTKNDQIQFREVRAPDNFKVSIEQLILLTIEEGQPNRRAKKWAFWDDLLKADLTGGALVHASLVTSPDTGSHRHPNPPITCRNQSFGGNEQIRKKENLAKTWTNDSGMSDERTSNPGRQMSAGAFYIFKLSYPLL